MLEKKSARFNDEIRGLTPANRLKIEAEVVKPLSKILEGRNTGINNLATSAGYTRANVGGGFTEQQLNDAIANNERLKRMAEENGDTLGAMHAERALGILRGTTPDDNSGSMVLPLDANTNIKTRTLHIDGNWDNEDAVASTFTGYHEGVEAVDRTRGESLYASNPQKVIRDAIRNIEAADTNVLAAHKINKQSVLDKLKGRVSVSPLELRDIALDFHAKNSGIFARGTRGGYLTDAGSHQSASAVVKELRDRERFAYQDAPGFTMVDESRKADGTDDYLRANAGLSPDDKKPVGRVGYNMLMRNKMSKTTVPIGDGGVEIKSAW